MGCLESAPEQHPNKPKGHNPKPLIDYSDFTKYYKYIRKKLKAQEFKFGYSPDLVSFKRHLAASSGIHKQVAKTWIAMYVDYMILIAWKIHFSSNINPNLENNVNIDSNMTIYPPYTIHQVIRLHVVDIQNYASFCLLITDGKGIIPYCPFKLITQQGSPQESYNQLRDTYNNTREFLKQHLYENPALQKTFQRKSQAESLWEDFDMTLMQNEFCFYFLSTSSKEKFQKTVADNADELTMTNREPEEIIRVAKGIRKVLGVGELISVNDGSSSVYKPIFKTLDNNATEEEGSLKHLKDTSFSIEFVNILAWEQQISVEEAKEWIDEYMKVLFMVVSSEGKIGGYASEVVNQVWYLHKRFVRDYQALWQKIDPSHQILFKIDIGITETLQERYENTLVLYNRHFGRPNKQIWPDLDLRFNETGNLSSYYLFFARNCITEEQKAKLFKKYLEYTEKKKKDKYDQGEEQKDDIYHNDGYPGSDFGTLVLGLMMMGGTLNFNHDYGKSYNDLDQDESQDQLLDNQSIANYTNDEFSNRGTFLGLADINGGAQAAEWRNEREDGNGNNNDNYSDDGGDDDGGD